MQSSRRKFLQLSSLALGALGLRPASHASETYESVAIIADPSDPVASSPPCRWALEKLVQEMEKHRINVRRVISLDQAPSRSLCIEACGADSAMAASLLKKSSLKPGGDHESLVLAPLATEKHRGILACGAGSRGLMYALLELADRLEHSENPFAALSQDNYVVEGAANSMRSIGRLFTSDVEDKPWFYNREMWPTYFSMLATQRFNRFSLNFGIGYDSLDNVRDAYFLFAYPFLISVPSYNVKAINLPDEERDRNLEMLQFISAQAVAHGIDFQLGIWTHGYQWGPNPQANYTMDGLSSENHAAYSRDALAALLKACPDISGVTIRTHGESGVREGSYSFWQTVFSGAAQCGRKVNIDLHTKGLDQKLIDAALATGMPVTLSPKYWAEHMGLPYQQAAIRDLEMPEGGAHAQSFYSLSTGSRIFTRYGYADFLREDRPYRVMFRIWPGTHRFLLWGDPASSAAHARAFQFCGCNGVELFEPLSFKGREGSGLPGSRCGYADPALDPRGDWEKYLYTYRVWGRLLYNPETPPDTWQRYSRKQFQDAAPAAEAALASVTSILPIVTTAHLPSAANAIFNPELYTNQSLLDASKSSPYGDTPAPKVFENVSPLDPQLFSSITEFVTGLLKGEHSGKYSPIDVAQWLEDRGDAAIQHLGEAEARVPRPRSPEFRRMAIDTRIQIGLGRFFAAELRAGILFSIYEQSGDRIALEQALEKYRSAREVWNDFAQAAKSAYVSDITFGPRPYQRGHWLDRLPAIDADIQAMEKRLESSVASQSSDVVRSAVREALSRPRRPSLQIRHTPPPQFRAGGPLELSLEAQDSAMLQIRVYYRHVNQPERYEVAHMRADGHRFDTTIPGSYTDSKYPLQYYFELRRGSAEAWLYPGLGPNLLQQPYFVVRQLR